MSRVLATLALAALVGCAARRDAALDASLPDGAAVEASAPTVAVEAFAASADPRVRAAALVGAVRATSGSDLERWSTQGTYDPDPWVQERVAEALAARGDADPIARDARLELALRGSADPYVRARVAHTLLDAGVRAPLEPLREAWRERADWRAAPLALVAARLGVDEARAVVERALADNELRDDAAFVVDLGRFGWPGLLPALAKAQAAAEEEGGDRLALPRAMLGDAEGRAAWNAVLRTRDPYVQRDALDLVRALPPADAAPWLALAARCPDRGVRLAVAVLRGPTVANVGQALGARDPYARAYGARGAAALPASDAEPLLRRALLDADPEVRIAAAEAVADAGLVALAPALQPLAVDDRSVVRAAGQAARLRLEALAWGR